MNSGVIANRYAEAFFKLAKESPDGEIIYQQSRRILSTLSRMPKVRFTILDPNLLDIEEKVKLIDTMVSPETLRPEIARFVTLMCEHGRSEFIRIALLDFLNQYITYKGQMMIRITTAKAVDQKLNDAIFKSIKDNYDVEPLIFNLVDPSILGGFIVENWDYRFDASVKTSLETACRKLSKIQKRII